MKYKAYKQTNPCQFGVFVFYVFYKQIGKRHN